MVKQNKDSHIKFIFFISVIYTLSIIALTFSITYYLDQIKIREVLYDYKYEVLTINEYDLFTEYLDNYFKKNKSFYCEYAYPLLDSLTEDIKRLGIKLSKYGKSSSSLSEIDYDYLKRKYYLVMLKEYNILWKIKARCNNINIGVFFFKKDHEPSLIMGRVYEEVSKRINNTYILSFDIEYEDIALLNYLKSIYSLKNSDAPVFILNDKCIIKGVKSIDEVIKYINENKCLK